MDSSPFQDQFAVDTSLYPVDQLLGATPSSVGGSIGGPGTVGSGQPGIVTDGTTGAGTFGSTVGQDILGLIPGASSIADLLKVVTDIINDIEQTVGFVVGYHPLNFIKDIAQWYKHASAVVQADKIPFVQWMSNLAFGGVFKSFLEDGLGVDTSNFKDEQNAAVTTVDTMLGFAFAIQFIVAAIETVGEGLFANRWGQALKHTIAKLPEEMGLSWALGLTIDELFRSAQGVVLEEEVNAQKRPNRIQWQQLRVLLKQHVINEDQFNKLLIKQGFPDDQIAMILKLVDAQIPVGDIAQLWYRGDLTDDEAKKKLSDLGFSDDDVAKLFDLYAAKSENEASVTYRSVAQQLFVNHLISEDQYRAILTNANYPEKLIDQNIAAIRLEQDVGRLLQSVGVIKARFQHGQIDAGEASKELRELNYADSYIAELLQAWENAPLRRTHGLSQSKILSYYVSGIMTVDQARTGLLATGLKDADVQFLLDHPTANTGARVHQRTPSLVTQAYVDGAIDDASLADAFTSAGVQGTDLSWYVSIAHYRLAHKRGAVGADVPLDLAQWKAAYKVGLIDFQALVTRIESLGYNPDNALLLAEIENKGPYQPPAPPAFATLQDAISYMEGLGYAIEAPPNPRLLAAEGVLSAAGYTWIAPVATAPPAVPGPIANP